ncbi:MAG: hypothetical protein NT124_01150 [Candidatus Dependentiae bacterium]|nr:hypothetical protein [Candidatus Dependentiae bacterium]
MKMLLYSVILFFNMPFFMYAMSVSAANAGTSSENVQALCATCANCTCEYGLMIDCKKAAAMYCAFFCSAETVTQSKLCTQETQYNQPEIFPTTLKRTRKYDNLCLLVSYNYQKSNKISSPVLKRALKRTKNYDNLCHLVS